MLAGLVIRLLQGLEGTHKAFLSDGQASSLRGKASGCSLFLGLIAP
jgi:hypothetical protein